MNSSQILKKAISYMHHQSKVGRRVTAIAEEIGMPQSTVSRMMIEPPKHLRAKNREKLARWINSIDNCDKEVATLNPQQEQLPLTTASSIGTKYDLERVDLGLSISQIISVGDFKASRVKQIMDIITSAPLDEQKALFKEVEKQFALHYMRQ